jgi:hypothetical protein
MTSVASYSADNKSTHQHWRASQGIYAMEAALVLEFEKSI